MSQASLRLEILGTTSDRIGPFALLGLTPQRCEPHHVRTAVEALLARVDAHPQRDTSEAQALRREIDAAASLLLDPSSRDELAAAYDAARRSANDETYEIAPAGPRGRAAGGDNGAARGSAGGSYSPAFLRDLLAAWVSAGGWNGKARHRIIAAGVQHGISGEALLDAILTMPATLASPRETPLVGPPPAAWSSGGGNVAVIALPASLSPLSERDAHEAAKRNLFAAMLAFVLCALLVVPFAAWVFIQINVMSPKPDPSLLAPAVTPAIPSNADATPALPTVRSEDLAVRVNPLSQTFAGLLERLDRDSTLADALDANILGEFASAATQGRRQWTQFNTAARERLRGVLVSSLYRLGRDRGAAQSLIDCIDPDEPKALSVENIPGRAWSVGMLAVLMREPDLPAAARRVVEEHWRRHVPSGAPPQSSDFNAAARFALREMVEPLVVGVAVDADALERWVAWLQCVTSVSSADEAEALALEASRQVLIDGPDISASEPSAKVIAALFSAVRWKTSAAARAAMLSWWDEPRVSASDLAVVSSWLVSTGAVPGLDDSFIVPPKADAEARATLRQKLADAWTTAAPSADHTTTRTEVSDWVARADRLLIAPAGATPEDLLAQTIETAMFNTAAGLLWSGRAGDATLVLRDLDARIAAARLVKAPTTSAPAPANRSADGQWSIRYFRTIKSNDREGLKGLIEGLAQESSGDLGPIDAATLADVALASPIRELRPLALDQIAATYGAGPTVLLALADRMIPDRPEAGLAEAIETITGQNLPDPRSNEWYAQARLALIRRVADLRGSMAVNGSIDALADLLGEAYATRLSHSIDPTAAAAAGGSIGGGVDPADAAQRAFAQWIEVARPMQPLAPLPAPLHQIEHRADIRAAVLDDPIGRFHAWQVASLEAACYVASAERPAAREALAELLKVTTLRLAVARNVMEQLLVAERAMLRVWEIRFGAETEGMRG